MRFLKRSPVATMVGGTVGQVIRSKHPKFKEGDYVAEYSGWQSHAVSNGAMLLRDLRFDVSEIFRTRRLLVG